MSHRAGSALRVRGGAPSNSIEQDSVPSVPPRNIAERVQDALRVQVQSGAGDAYEELLQCGQWYSVDQQCQQEGLPLGEPHRCFLNATRMALSGPEYAVAVGLAIMPPLFVPVTHAFNVDGDVVVDTTPGYRREEDQLAGGWYFAAVLSSPHLIDAMVVHATPAGIDILDAEILGARQVTSLFSLPLKRWMAARVRVHGLCERPEYNDRMGAVISVDHSRGRAGVKLDSRTRLWIKPINMEVKQVHLPHWGDVALYRGSLWVVVDYDSDVDYEKMDMKIWSFTLVEVGTWKTERNVPLVSVEFDPPANPPTESTIRKHTVSGAVVDTATKKVVALVFDLLVVADAVFPADEARGRKPACRYKNMYLVEGDRLLGEGEMPTQCLMFCMGRVEEEDWCYNVWVGNQDFRLRLWTREAMSKAIALVRGVK